MVRGMRFELGGACIHRLEHGLDAHPFAQASDGRFIGLPKVRQLTVRKAELLRAEQYVAGDLLHPVSAWAPLLYS